MNCVENSFRNSTAGSIVCAVRIERNGLVYFILPLPQREGVGSTILLDQLCGSGPCMGESDCHISSKVGHPIGLPRKCCSHNKTRVKVLERGVSEVVYASVFPV